jgi:Family of unknown function (DUF6502)
LLCYTASTNADIFLSMENSFNNKQILIAGAMKRVLRPFIKLMLANDLTYTFAIDLLKTLFVEVAENEFTLDGKRQTDTRISLISGVHHLPEVDEVVPENISLGSQIMAVWNSNPKYLDRDGMPKPLQRLASSGSEDTFDSLVRSVSTDIHPRAVLDEWLRLGFAKIDDENFVRITSDAFIPQIGFEEKAYFFGHNLHDHAAAAVSNLIGQQNSYLERCVHYDELSMASVQEISEVAKKQGMKTLTEVFKVADSHSKINQGKNANMRMTYGIYFYHEPMQRADVDAEEN